MNKEYVEQNKINNIDVCDKIGDIIINSGFNGLNSDDLKSVINRCEYILSNRNIKTIRDKNKNINVDDTYIIDEADKDTDDILLLKTIHRDVDLLMDNKDNNKQFLYYHKLALGNIKDLIRDLTIYNKRKLKRCVYDIYR